MNKAQVKEVPVGPISIEGLMLPDGTFTIGVSQLIRLNIVSQANATREVQDLLGKNFQFAKVVSEFNTKPVSVLTLPQFSEVVKLAAIKGNQAAIDFAIAMMGLALHQLFCDTFGVKMGTEERQQYLLGEMRALEKEKYYYHTGMVKANMRANQTRKEAAKVSSMRRLHGEIMQARGAKREKLEKEFYGVADGTIAVDYKSLDELAPAGVPEICDS